MIFIISLVLTLLPFAFEKILFCTSLFPFNINIHLSRETWFSFIGSYIGAIGTILLGLIALHQNQKYKELSDKSEARFLSLQEDMKELTKQSVALIKTNTRIEEAKYFPIICDIHQSYYSMPGLDPTKHFECITSSFQVTYNDFLLSPPTSIDHAFKNYHTLTYALKNDSANTLRNLQCYNVLKNHKDVFENYLYQSCDVSIGDTIYFVYATDYDLMDYVCQNKITSLHFFYKVQNVLSDFFTFEAILNFIHNEDDKQVITSINITPIQKVNTEPF